MFLFIFSKSHNWKHLAHNVVVFVFAFVAVSNVKIYVVCLFVECIYDMSGSIGYVRNEYARVIARLMQMKPLYT